MITETEQKHEERNTEAYNIQDALHELEVDLRYNAKFPNESWNGKSKRTDVIRIHTGFNSPSMIISKTQCKKWMREHFQQKPTQASNHWVKDGELYVSIRRTCYWIWVSCGEHRERTALSQAGIDAGDKARDAIFDKLKEGDE